MRGLQIIVAFSALVAVGYAIQCHQCNSHENSECAKYDDMGVYQGQGTLKDCTGGEKYCRKILQVVRDEESIIRTCGSEEHRKAEEDIGYSPKKPGGFCYTTVMEEYNTEVSQYIHTQRIGDIEGVWSPRFSSTDSVLNFLAS